MSQQRLPNMSDEKTSGNAAGSGTEGDIIKIDNVLVYTNDDTIVIESKSRPIIELLGCLLSFLFAIILVLTFQLQFSILLPVLFMALFIMIFLLVSKLASDVIDRKIIDKKKMIIRFEKEKGKLKTKAQYSTSVVKNVKVVVDDYSRMGVYLDFYPGSVTESVCIIGGEVWDNAKKLELAHKIAEFLGVPVIEKT